MPAISVPDPLATYIVYGVFLCLCFGQWVIRFFVPQRYRRSNLKPMRRRNKTVPNREIEAALSADEGH